MNARCCIPPESVRSAAPARSASPTRSIARSTARRSSARSGPSGPRTARRPVSTVSRTVTGVPVASWARCATYATRGAPREPGGRPKTRTAPAVGRSSPSARRRSVVLPPPFGPAIPRNAPCSTASETCSSAGGPPRYAKDTSSSSSAGTAGSTCIRAPSGALRGSSASRRSSRGRRPPRTGSGTRAGRASP